MAVVCLCHAVLCTWSAVAWQVIVLCVAYLAIIMSWTQHCHVSCNLSPRGATALNLQWLVMGTSKLAGRVLTCTHAPVFRTSWELTGYRVILEQNMTALCKWSLITNDVLVAPGAGEHGHMAFSAHSQYTNH